jgi:hypothetical protein
MSEFPLLKTGAVLQYPAQKDLRFSTTVVRFADGSEQRFRQYETPLHRWIVQLDLLDESELNRVREFFRAQSGASGTFEFTDPWDSTNYSHCSLEDDQLMDTLLSEFDGKTSLTIRENRG